MRRVFGAHRIDGAEIGAMGDGGNKPPMSTNTKLLLVAVAALIVGAAYGPRIPVVKQAARALPGSAVL